MAHPNAVPGFSLAQGNGFNGVQVLTSWKDIANYMGKGVRTVQRWEQDFALPVRRPIGSNKKAILARRGDLDSWVALRCRPRLSVAHRETPEAGDNSIRSALAANIETANALRQINWTMRQALHLELIALQQELAAICCTVGRQFPGSSGPLQ